MIVSVCDGFEEKNWSLIEDSLRYTPLGNEELFIWDVEFN